MVSPVVLPRTLCFAKRNSRCPADGQPLPAIAPDARAKCADPGTACDANHTPSPAFAALRRVPWLAWMFVVVVVVPSFVWLCLEAISEVIAYGRFEGWW